MSILLGPSLSSPIKIPTTFLHEILKEIKHYLTLQSIITFTDTDHCLTITSSRKLLSSQANYKNEFNIPKNFCYLFTHWQKIIVENQEDLEFFDICYECLIIIKEYLPTKVQIGVEIMDQLAEQSIGSNAGLSLVDFLENFQAEKNQEFLRRVNSNFKSLISQQSQMITQFEVENLLHLSEHFYFYKNKIAALKYLAFNELIQKETFASIEEKYLNFLNDLSLDSDFKPYCDQVLEKVEVAKEILLNQQENYEYVYESQQRSEMGNFYSQSDSQQIKEQISKDSDKSQKQFRLSSKQQKPIKKNETKEKSPLKPSKNVDKNIVKISDPSLKNTKSNQLKNISVKSLLFQLRQSQSLKRLSMLIETASQIKIEDEKYQIKIQKEIEDICRKFLKEKYIQRYQTNQSVLQQSQKKTQAEKARYLDQSTIPTAEQIQEVMIFYESLVVYFSKKNVSLKSYKLQTGRQSVQKNFQHKSSNVYSSSKNNKYKELLDQVCHKIQQEYYGQ